MFVMLDSNIWISQRGLKSAQALDGLDFIKRRNWTLEIPEVVRLEVETKLYHELLTHTKQIGDSVRYMDTLLSNITSPRLPTPEEIQIDVQRLIEDTGIRTREIPFTIDAAKSSLHKIMNKLQPSDRSEQFGDGVIWANCLELLRESEVCLVTRDKAFYRDYDYNHGLAHNLVDEAAKCRNSIHLFPGFDGLLQASRQDVHRVWPKDAPTDILDSVGKQIQAEKDSLSPED